MAHIEELSQLTVLDLSCNPIQGKKYYYLQVLFRIPQLRTLDGQFIDAEDRVKAENLHGLDTKDREVIFGTLLPEEAFVDRRINTIVQVEMESDDEVTAYQSRDTSISQIAR